jgi:zinc D-Ala-D-Ala carboxypeptidase
MSDWNYKNFSREEMRCKCGCNRDGIKPEFMERLQQLRTAYNAPMPISSAYRCPDHPVEKRKGSIAGTHALGIAADIAVQGKDAHRLLSLALQFGFKGIGVQQKGSGRFIHIDLRDSETIWSY